MFRDEAFVTIIRIRIRSSDWNTWIKYCWLYKKKDQRRYVHSLTASDCVVLCHFGTLGPWTKTMSQNTPPFFITYPVCGIMLLATGNRLIQLSQHISGANKHVLCDSTGRRLLEACTWSPLDFAPCVFPFADFCFVSLYWNKAQLWICAISYCGCMWWKPHVLPVSHLTGRQSWGPTPELGLAVRMYWSLHAMQIEGRLWGIR